jgi:hypothetical protein
MGSIYCPHCGSKNDYNLQRPNFCNSCGNSFVGSQAAQKINLSKPQDLNEDESDSTEVPELRSLAYEVSYEKTKYSGRDFVGDMSEEIKEQRKMEKTKKSSRAKKTKAPVPRKSRNN